MKVEASKYFLLPPSAVFRHTVTSPLVRELGRKGVSIYSLSRIAKGKPAVDSLSLGSYPQDRIIGRSIGDRKGIDDCVRLVFGCDSLELLASGEGKYGESKEIRRLFFSPSLAPRPINRLIFVSLDLYL